MSRLSGWPAFLLMTTAVVLAVAAGRGSVQAAEEPESLYLTPQDCPNKQLSLTEFTYGDNEERRDAQGLGIAALSEFEVTRRHPGVGLRPLLMTPTDQVFKIVVPADGAPIGLIHLVRPQTSWHIEMLQECS